MLNITVSDFFCLETLLNAVCYIIGLFIMLRCVAASRRAASPLSRLSARAAILLVLLSQGPGSVIVMAIGLVISFGLLVLSVYLSFYVRSISRNVWDS